MTTEFQGEGSSGKVSPLIALRKAVGRVSTLALLIGAIHTPGFARSQEPRFPMAGVRRPVTQLTLIRSRFPVPESGHRVRNALIGGLIGGATGIVTCTVISNLVNDPGTGFSTCTTKGYLIFGGGGFGIGALLGALIR